MKVQRNPPRVTDVTQFWTTKPPDPSQRCKFWIGRIRRGWRRNHRMKTWGYEESAIYFGVYIWEWSNVLMPLLTQLEGNECQTNVSQDNAAAR